MPRALAAILFVVLLLPSGAAAQSLSIGIAANLHPTKGSWPQHLTAMGNTLYFMANADTMGTGAGPELYRFVNGKASLVADIYPGAGSSWLQELTPFKGKLYFSARGKTGGAELRRLDGSVVTLVADLKSGGSSHPRELTPVGNYLYFRANTSKIYRHDPSTGNTKQVPMPLTFPKHLTALGSTLFFSLGFADTGRELWRLGSLGAKPTMIEDIDPGSGSSNPRMLTTFGRRLYFVADDGTHGGEVYQYDPRTSKPKRITNLSTTVNGMAVYGGALYIFGRPGLWRYDGSTLTKVSSTVRSQAPTVFTAAAYAGSLYWGRGDVNGDYLYRYTHSTKKVEKVFKFPHQGTAAQPRRLTATDQGLFFTALDASGEPELWRAKVKVRVRSRTKKTR